MIRILIAVILAAVSAGGALPPGCSGSTTLGTFQLSVRPFSRGVALPLKSMAAIPAGSRLIWSPVHLAPQVSPGAEVAVVLVPASGGDLIIWSRAKRGNAPSGNYSNARKSSRSCSDLRV